MASHAPLDTIHDTDAPTYRTPPHNLEAEQALLGAILINNEALSQVAAFLEPEHFYLPVHGRIFGAIAIVIERGQIANPVTLKHHFDQDEALKESGGAQYLARLAGSAVTIINAEHYGHTIHGLALRRGLVGIGEEVVNQAYDAPLDVSASQQIEEAEQRLYLLAEEGKAENGFKPFSTSLTSAVSMIEQAYKRDGHKIGRAHV